MHNTALTFFQRMNKKTPFFSKFYPIYVKKENILNHYEFQIKQIHQYDKNQKRQHLSMSDLEFRPIHKFFRVIISSIKYMKNSNSDIISLHVNNNSP